jgi:hypothetical protein
MNKREIREQEAIGRMMKFVSGNKDAEKVVQYFLDKGYTLPRSLHLTCKVKISDYLQFRIDNKIKTYHFSPMVSSISVEDWIIALEYIKTH